MEAVGAAANILSLFEGATQYGKCLYETVSSLKTAPQQVTSLASAVIDLQNILSQLQKEVTRVDSDADLQIITRVVTNCHDDLRRYKDDLDKVASTSEITKVQRAWKTVRVHLMEKEIQRIHTEVIRHVSVLTYQLSVLQSTAARLSTNKLIELKDAFSSSSAQHLAILLEQNSQLSTVKSRLGDLGASTADLIEAAAGSIMQRIETSSHISTGKSEDIHDLLKAIQAQVGELSTKVSPAQNPKEESSQTDSEHECDRKQYKEDAELTESMYRLSQLAMNNA
ncbi:MAG: hypothetical protein M1820_002073 [Bogoriella megaspora]|nr:MAG: hypothetical protein M1820_002073 [Bogoriella megaspora]